MGRRIFVHLYMLTSEFYTLWRSQGSFTDLILQCIYYQTYVKTRKTKQTRNSTLHGTYRSLGRILCYHRLNSNTAHTFSIWGLEKLRRNFLQLLLQGAIVLVWPLTIAEWDFNVPVTYFLRKKAIPLKTEKKWEQKIYCKKQTEMKRGHKGEQWCKTKKDLKKLSLEFLVQYAVVNHSCKIQLIPIYSLTQTFGALQPVITISQEAGRHLCPDVQAHTKGIQSVEQIQFHAMNLPF